MLLDRSLRPIALRDGDTILLASDGLFKTLPYDAMTPLMDNDPQILCEKLLERTLAAQKPQQHVAQLERDRGLILDDQDAKHRRARYRKSSDEETVSGASFRAPLFREPPFPRATTAGGGPFTRTSPFLPRRATP